MKNQHIVSMSAHQLMINEFTVNKIYFLGTIWSTVNLVVMFGKEFMNNPVATTLKVLEHSLVSLKLARNFRVAKSNPT